MRETRIGSVTVIYPDDVNPSIVTAVFNNAVVADILAALGVEHVYIGVPVDAEKVSSERNAVYHGVVPVRMRDSEEEEATDLYLPDASEAVRRVKLPWAPTGYTIDERPPLRLPVVLEAPDGRPFATLDPERRVYSTAIVPPLMPDVITATYAVLAAGLAAGEAAQRITRLVLEADEVVVRARAVRVENDDP